MWKPLAWQHALVIFASFECIAKWKLYFDWIPSSKKIIFSFCVLVLLLKSKIKTCGTSTLTPCQALRQVLLQNILKTFPPCPACLAKVGLVRGGSSWDREAPSCLLLAGLRRKDEGNPNLLLVQPCHSFPVTPCTTWAGSASLQIPHHPGKSAV